MGMRGMEIETKYEDFESHSDKDLVLHSRWKLIDVVSSAIR